MGLWTYLCYLISVVLYCGLCIRFWFLCVFFGLISHGISWFWFLCVLWVDFSSVWVGYDFSVLWVDFLWVWVVLISLLFGWFLMGLGWFWFLCSLVDFSWIRVLISQLFESGFFNFSILYVGHLSAIILHDQSRFNISYFSSFEEIFCQLDPN